MMMNQRVQPGTEGIHKDNQGSVNKSFENHFYSFPSLHEESDFAMHLQWFAAEDEGRTEEPTEQKIRKSREDGKVAKSADLVAALILLFSLLLIAIMSPYMVKTLKSMLQFFLVQSTEADITSDGMIPKAFISYYLKLTLPVMGIAFFAALLGNLFQVGFLFTTKPIQPDFSKISPNVIKWAQRVMFSSEGLFNMAKSLFKIAVIVTLAYFNISRKVPEITNLVYGTVGDAASVVGGLAFRLMIETALLLLVFSLPDYFFQRKQHLESLKMTKHEIKEEMKQSDGDPLIKSRLRQKMRELLTNQMMQSVPDADMVVTNPTHFAVALEYKQDSMTAPRVCAKGMDEVAQRIKALARDNDVPIVENKPLARALHANVEIGDEIPEEYYSVVSGLLVKIYEMTGKSVS
ncbi:MULTISPECIES: flagellar biosynthesis protein FlhB [unclassified Oceanispirochaeta]|nr:MULTISPECIES: flagellar biosynthesis protein FlhB [unclassified Oceanispirochaeta]